MACNCKKPKTPPPPTSRMVVTESKKVDNIVDRLKELMK